MRNTAYSFYYFVVIKYCIRNTDCIVTQTPDEYKYQYVWPEIPDGVTSFTFKVKANNDVHVALSSTNADEDQMYEIGKIEME